jgi:hypothetical protein
VKKADHDAGDARRFKELCERFHRTGLCGRSAGR